MNQNKACKQVSIDEATSVGSTSYMSVIIYHTERLEDGTYVTRPTFLDFIDIGTERSAHDLLYLLLNCLIENGFDVKNLCGFTSDG